MHGAGGYSWWFDTVPPSGVTAAVAPGGSVPVGSYVYAVSMTGADGAETIASTPSAPVTTNGGSQTVKVAWTNPTGSYSSNVYRCPTSKNCTNSDGSLNSNGTWYRVGEHVAGTTFADAVAAPTQWNLPTVSGTGATIMNSGGLYSPFFEAPPIAVSQLPAAAAGNAGQVRRVNDSTGISSEGQNCVGGGTNTALAFSNGKVWKCF